MTTFAERYLPRPPVPCPICAAPMRWTSYRSEPLRLWVQGGEAPHGARKTLRPTRLRSPRWLLWGDCLGHSVVGELQVVRGHWDTLRLIDVTEGTLVGLPDGLGLFVTDRGLAGIAPRTGGGPRVAGPIGRLAPFPGGIAILRPRTTPRGVRQDEVYVVRYGHAEPEGPYVSPELPPGDPAVAPQAGSTPPAALWTRLGVPPQARWWTPVAIVEARPPFPE